MKYLTFAALIGSISAINVRGDGEAQGIIDDAVSDVLKIASAKAPFEYPLVSSTHTVHHVVPQPVAVPHQYPVAVPHTVPVAVPHPVAVPYGVPVYADAPAPSSGAPNSKVIKAVAASNEAKAMKKVTEQRNLADKMEKLESQSQINEAINENVKKEE